MPGSTTKRRNRSSAPSVDRTTTRHKTKLRKLLRAGDTTDAVRYCLISANRDAQAWFVRHLSASTTRLGGQIRHPNPHYSPRIAATLQTWLSTRNFLISPPGLLLMTAGVGFLAWYTGLFEALLAPATAAGAASKSRKSHDRRPARGQLTHVGPATTRAHRARSTEVADPSILRARTAPQLTGHTRTTAANTSSTATGPSLVTRITSGVSDAASGAKAGLQRLWASMPSFPGPVAAAAKELPKTSGTFPLTIDVDGDPVTRDITPVYYQMPSDGSVVALGHFTHGGDSFVTMVSNGTTSECPTTDTSIFVLKPNGDGSAVLNGTVCDGSVVARTTSWPLSSDEYTDLCYKTGTEANAEAVICIDGAAIPTNGSAIDVSALDASDVHRIGMVNGLEETFAVGDSTHWVTNSDDVTFTALKTRTSEGPCVRVMRTYPGASYPTTTFETLQSNDIILLCPPPAPNTETNFANTFRFVGDTLCISADGGMYCKDMATTTFPGSIKFNFEFEERIEALAGTTALGEIELNGVPHLLGSNESGTFIYNPSSAAAPVFTPHSSITTAAKFAGLGAYDGEAGVYLYQGSAIYWAPISEALGEFQTIHTAASEITSVVINPDDPHSLQLSTVGLADTVSSVARTSPPEFADDCTFTAEDVQPGDKLGTCPIARSNGQTFTRYTITGPAMTLFKIDATTGEVSVRSDISQADFTAASYDITIHATTDTGETTTTTVTTSVTAPPQLDSSICEPVSDPQPGGPICTSHTYLEIAGSHVTNVAITKGDPLDLFEATLNTDSKTVEVRLKADSDPRRIYKKDIPLELTITNEAGLSSTATITTELTVPARISGLPDKVTVVEDKLNPDNAIFLFDASSPTDAVSASDFSFEQGGDRFEIRAAGEKFGVYPKTNISVDSDTPFPIRFSATTGGLRSNTVSSTLTVTPTPDPAIIDESTHTIDERTATKPFTPWMWAAAAAVGAVIVSAIYLIWERIRRDRSAQQREDTDWPAHNVNTERTLDGDDGSAHITTEAPLPAPSSSGVMTLGSRAHHNPLYDQPGSWAPTVYPSGDDAPLPPGTAIEMREMPAAEPEPDAFSEILALMQQWQSEGQTFPFFAPADDHSSWVRAEAALAGRLPASEGAAVWTETPHSRSVLFSDADPAGAEVDQYYGEEVAPVGVSAEMQLILAAATQLGIDFSKLTEPQLAELTAIIVRHSDAAWEHGLDDISDIKPDSEEANSEAIALATDPAAAPAATPVSLPATDPAAAAATPVRPAPPPVIVEHGVAQGSPPLPTRDLARLVAGGSPPRSGASTSSPPKSVGAVSFDPEGVEAALGLTDGSSAGGPATGLSTGASLDGDAVLDALGLR